MSNLCCLLLLNLFSYSSCFDARATMRLTSHPNKALSKSIFAAPQHRNHAAESCSRLWVDEGFLIRESQESPHILRNFRKAHLFQRWLPGLILASILASPITSAWAETEADIPTPPDVVISDLPPPYVPAIFGLVLLVGVGLLTGSLGDVIADEASLGTLSGAKAKKEMERSRSSYFKK